MRILYLTNKPIFPVIDGGCMAMHQLLECLIKNNYKIKHICLSTKKHPYSKTNYPGHINNLVDTESYEINTDIKIIPAAKHLLTRNSYNISRFDNQEIHKKIINELSKEKYTIIILESLFLSPYINTIKKISEAKIVVRTHNVEHKIWEQLSLNCKNPIKKWYLKRLSEDLKKFEMQVLKDVDLVATISRQDADEFQKLGLKTPIEIIPVAMEQHENLFNYSKRTIFFLGSMNWLPNIEAVNWLTKEILPAVRKKIPNLELHLAGSYMLDSFPTNQIDGVLNYGFVDDRIHFMQNNGILVLPIRSGSGVRIKLLEAMSLGVPVISTKAGALGISKNETIIFAETTDEFVKQIIELIQSDEKRIELGKNAYQYIKENYSISKISNLLSEQFEKL